MELPSNGTGTNVRSRPIWIDVLLRLGEQSIIALPVYDCIVVPESAETTASEVMLDSFKLHTGQPGRIAVERALLACRDRPFATHGRERPRVVDASAISAAHGGLLAVMNRDGGGAIIRITLPVGISAAATG